MKTPKGRVLTFHDREELAALSRSAGLLHLAIQGLTPNGSNDPGVIGLETLACEVKDGLGRLAAEEEEN